MARKVPPLSDRQIKATQPKATAVVLTDSDGLRLLISPDGRKLWEFVYESPTQNKRRKTSFGVYPDVSLVKAQQKRKEYREFVFNGIDPIDEKREIKVHKALDEKGIFQNVLKQWLNSQVDRVGVETLKRKTALFETFVLPVFKDKSIADITHKELTTLLEIKAIQHPETARRLFANFDNLWRYACSREYCKFNIVANIHKESTLPIPKAVHYSNITDPIILKELVNALYTYSGHYSVKNALKLVLHVPLRASNLVGLKWSYIDFDNQSLTIPRLEMKSKNKDTKDFTLPLTDEAIKILREQYLFTSNREYVFTGDNGRHINKETPTMALKRLGFDDEENGRKQHLHSFRGTYRSLADTHQRTHGCSFESKEKVLDHAVGDKTERAYTHSAIYFDEMKILLNWWSGFILDMVEVK